MTARVLVVMRTKDRPVLLPRALDSVLEQRFADWHLVIVNDGGAPEPVEALAAARAERFAGRLTLVHHARSRGMEAASNVGIARVDGELVTIHDDDDSWHPEFLAACVETMDAHRDDPRTGGVATHTTRVVERIEGDRVVREREEPFLPALEAVTLFRMAGRNVMPPIAFVYKRAILDEIGGYREDLPVLGDWEFNLRFLRRYDIAVVPRPLAFYHHRPAPGAGVYGNSISAGLSSHLRHDARLQNELLRAGLGPQAADLGAVVGVSRNFVELRDELQGIARALAHAIGHEARQAEARGAAERAAYTGQLHARIDGLEARLAGLEARLAEIVQITAEHAHRPPPRMPETLFGYVKDSVYNFAKRKNLIGRS